MQDLFDPKDPWAHYITNALKAKELFVKDVNYIVRDGEAVIVDEFTGRVMPGRRWSDGQHQAIEAKEALQIQAETQTLASITYQNFFLLYPRLAGMTGTAKTEEVEFEKTYKLETTIVPTNRSGSSGLGRSGLQNRNRKMAGRCQRNRRHSHERSSRARGHHLGGEKRTAEFAAGGAGDSPQPAQRQAGECGA